MFFARNKIKEVELVVDIGSSSVGATLVEISKNVAPKIIFSVRMPNQSASTIPATLESVMKTAAEKHVPVHKSHIIFSSPWYISQTKTIKIEHDTPMLVTHHVVDKLIKEAEYKFIEESKAHGEVVEHRVIRAKLNGYNTPDPYNKKAKTVEITSFASVVAKDVLGTVRRVVEKFFHVRNNEISSFSLVAFKTIAGILPSEKDYLIVDIRGEVTDLSLVTDDALIKNLSFPQGKDALVKAVSSGSGQSPVAALSLINIVSHGAGEPNTQTDVIKSAETFKQSWLQAYAKTLQEISAESIMPQSIFLIADSDVEVYFENILNETQNGHQLRLLKHLNTRSFIEPTSVPTDPFLALESIFVTII